MAGVARLLSHWKAGKASRGDNGPMRCNREKPMLTAFGRGGRVIL